jgi:hypothetical protein
MNDLTQAVQSIPQSLGAWLQVGFVAGAFIALGIHVLAAFRTKRVSEAEERRSFHGKRAA